MSYVILKHIYIYKSVYLYNHREWLSPCHREWIGLIVHTIVNGVLSVCQYIYNHREWLSPCHREWMRVIVHTIVNGVLSV